MDVRPFIGHAAKAVAALVVPWVVWAAAWLATATGVDVPVDPSKVETFVVSLITAGLVYAVRNRPKEA